MCIGDRSAMPECKTVTRFHSYCLCTSVSITCLASRGAVSVRPFIPLKFIPLKGLQWNLKTSEDSSI